MNFLALNSGNTVVFDNECTFGEASDPFKVNERNCTKPFFILLICVFVLFSLINLKVAVVGVGFG